MTGGGQTGVGRGVGPGRVDAALRDTMALLELVRREEHVLARLRVCVDELGAISRARSTLADRTGSEVVEAQGCLGAEAGMTSAGGWGR